MFPVLKEAIRHLIEKLGYNKITTKWRITMFLIFNISIIFLVSAFSPSPLMGNGLHDIITTYEGGYATTESSKKTLIENAFSGRGGVTQSFSELIDERPESVTELDVNGFLPVDLL